jgi:hypothetical protein
VAPPGRVIYCVDTSTFIYCQRSFGERISRLVLYKPVWDLLDRLAADGRLIAPHFVYVEITKNRDHVGVWATNHAGSFRSKGEYADLVLEILKEPGQQLVNPLSPRGGEEADPWVIALAEAINLGPPTLWERDVATVVSEEVKQGGIRDICLRRGVPHVDFAELLAAEGMSVSL